MKISIHDQIEEVEREIAMRKRVYGRKVLEGSMDPEESNRKINLMVAVKEALETMDTERQPSLFGETAITS